MSTDSQSNQIKGFIGNQQVINFVDHCFVKGFPAQAFGVYGQRHIGKKHFVRSIANSYNCQPGVSFFSLAPEEDKRDISIEQIRDWQKLMRLSSVSGSYIVGLIENGEALNSASANALLKIIEEPPKNVLIFVCASSPNSLLLTIQSRLFAINLKKIDKDLLINELQNNNFPNDAIMKVIDLSLGLPGLAVKMINDDDYYQCWQKEINEINQMMDGPLAKRLIWLHELFEKKKIGESFQVTELLAKISLLVGKKAELNPSRFAHALAWLAESPKLLKGNVNQKLLFEKIILSL